jgi:DNA-binding response OmpR family regulator
MATILSIDDDPGLQDLVGVVLEEHGHKVHWAFNGEEGFEKAKTVKPDLIILDMMLPTLNGAEVLKLLKAEPSLRAIPVIVVTAFFGDPPFDEKSLKELGALHLVKKPVPVEELAALVASTLGAKAGPPVPPGA